MTKYVEIVKFRLFKMPCCGQLLCWINPRLPNHCPECGKPVYTKLRTGEHTLVYDEEAQLKTGTARKEREGADSPR